MGISSANQAFVFLSMVMCGALCTLIFDFFRAIRRYKNSGAGIIALQDVLFWIIELCIVYMVAFRLNYAGVRGYVIIALVVGSVLYFVTISPYAIEFFVKVIAVAVKLALQLTRPIAVAYRAIAKMSGALLCKLYGVKSVFVGKSEVILAKIRGKT